MVEIANSFEIRIIPDDELIEKVLKHNEERIENNLCDQCFIMEEKSIDTYMTSMNLMMMSAKNTKMLVMNTKISPCVRLMRKH